MSNDTRMIQAYVDGKDLYCEIASIAFDLSYEECMEKHSDGSDYPEGKKRRGTAKGIVLGVCYGKGIASIAEDLHISKQKASEIYHKIMKEFPGLEGFIEECKIMAFEKGYVDTIWGRKRRLPNIQLPKYEFKYVGAKDRNFDPLADDEDDDDEIDPKLITYYTNALDKSWGFMKKYEIIQEALKEGIEIKDNSGLIAESERQCVNSRIQGSAADMCKRAMILAHNDSRMKELGFRLLIPVHDELIGEAPIRNVKEAAQRLSELMVQAADGLRVPFKVDTVVMKAWYDKEYSLEEADELINEMLKEEIV
jgi:DNA polymerase I-like protein with 3'-5' exonuclease and polymerase domains